MNNNMNELNNIKLNLNIKKRRKPLQSIHTGKFLPSKGRK